MSVDPSKLPDHFELSDGDKLNPLWIRLESYYTNRLAVLRAQNDGDLDAEQTGKVRGRIAEVKGFLALAKDRPIIMD